MDNPTFDIDGAQPLTADEAALEVNRPAPRPDPTAAVTVTPSDYWG
jgi:hypothetical protein